MMMSQDNLSSFLVAVHERVDACIEEQGLAEEQEKLLQAILEMYRARTLSSPSSDPVALFYYVAKTWERPIDLQAEYLGAFCVLYLIAADVADDVQDGDLAGKPLEEAGTAIALNTAFAALFVALDALRHATLLESAEERRLTYLEIFNRTSLTAVRGQHLDLRGAAATRTPKDVLAMQAAKTSSLTMVIDLAAAFARCDETIAASYHRVGERFVQAVQIVDDLRDFLGKGDSPDLATGKMTYPLACFLVQASPQQCSRFDELRQRLPESLEEISVLFYESGAIERCADTVEELRVAIHLELASMCKASPAHRMWLQLLDDLAGLIYELPSIEESRYILYPDGPWHERVRRMAMCFMENTCGFDPPPMPRLVPWHLPQWLYNPEQRTVFYPDLEGQPEEILPFQSMLLGMDLEEVRDVVAAQAPIVMAHEIFHYWRHVSDNQTLDSWYEEWAANRLAMAYVKTYQPDLVPQTRTVADRALRLHGSELSERGSEILESFFAPDYSPCDDTKGYEVNLAEVGLIQLAMVRRLSDQDLELKQVLKEFLPTPGLFPSQPSSVRCRQPGTADDPLKEVLL